MSPVTLKSSQQEAMGGLQGVGTMRLYLVQHGDALPEQVDPERPLSAKGRRDVEAVARVLASAGARAVRVAHSGKLRAQQTAEVLTAALAPAAVPEIMTGPQRSGRARGAKGRGLDVRYDTGVGTGIVLSSWDSRIPIGCADYALFEMVAPPGTLADRGFYAFR
jgi:hypothetical protein